LNLVKTTQHPNKEIECVKKQLQGIAIILLSVLFMLGYGHAPFSDLSFR